MKLSWLFGILFQFIQRSRIHMPDIHLKENPSIISTFDISVNFRNKERLREMSLKKEDGQCTGSLESSRILSIISSY